MTDYLLYAIILISMVFAIINVWNYKDYKGAKIRLKLSEVEIELLKLKLKNCEQRGTKCDNKPGTE